MKKIILAIIFLMLNFGVYSQSMGIGTTNFVPNSKSILEIQATGKGLLIPRMELANRPSGLSSTDNGMLIYQTTDTVGFYYYEHPNWKLMFTNTSAWSLNGNSGTNPSNDFIGTRDSIDLVFRTNLNERMRISSSGLIKTKNAICTEESTFDILSGNYNNINIGNSGFVVINSIETILYIIDSAGDGGFENSTSSFVANGWTQPTTTAPTWYVGTAGGFQGGAKAAFIGTSSSAFGSTATSGVHHFYRDIAIPSGATNVSLTFYLKFPVIDKTYDYFKIYTTTTSYTPDEGTTPNTGYTERFSYTTPVISSFTQQSAIDLSSLAGTTVRLVFTWINDGFSPNAYCAIDNISLTYYKKSVITGFNGGTNGRMLNVLFNTAHNIQINNKDASSSADNQIITNTGQNISLFGNGSATFIYSGSLKKWILISWLP